MKRKDFEDVDDDFYFLSSKSRRLDSDLFGTVNEDPRSAAEVFEKRPSSPGGTTVMQTDDLPSKEPLPSGDERAIVLYNPANSPFFKSPDSQDFSVIVNSDMIPGLRDHIFSWGNSKSLKPVEDRAAEEEKREVANDCLAVVPWVPCNSPLASRDETQAASHPEPMEVEMMDTDESGGEASGFGGMREGSGGLQHWPQQQLHWMEPQLLQNTYSPVT